MSEENIEIFRRSLDAINQRDRRGWLEMIDPDLVMIPARVWPENAPLRGAEAVWDFYDEVTTAWEGGSNELREVIASGTDQVVGNAFRAAHGKASGVNFEFDYWTVATFRDGKMIRAEWFSDRDEALVAAGLSE